MLYLCTELLANATYQLLTSQTKIGGIKCTILGDYFEDTDRNLFPLGEPTACVISRWISINDGRVRCLLGNGPRPLRRSIFASMGMVASPTSIARRRACDHQVLSTGARAPCISRAP